jgi:hypothetical protein
MNVVDTLCARSNSVFSAELSLPGGKYLMVEIAILSYRLNAEDPVQFFYTVDGTQTDAVPGVAPGQVVQSA